MALINKRVPHFQKPEGPVEIDYSIAPISLVSGFITDGVGVIDVVKAGNQGLLRNGASASVETHGRAILFNGTNDRVDIESPTLLAPINTCTVFSSFQVRSSQRGDLFSEGVNNDPDPLLRLSVNEESGAEDNVSFNVRGNSAAQLKVLSGDVNVNDGNRHTAAGVMRSLSDISVYFDGFRKGNDTSTTILSPGTNQQTLGALRRDTVAIHFNGIQYITWLFDADIGDDEIARLHENPYRYIKPRRRFYVIQGGAGPTPVNRDSTLQWDLISSLTRDYSLRWDILNTAQSDSDLRWNLLNAAQRDNTLQWDIQAKVIRDSDLRWNIQQAIERDADLRWNLLSSASKDSDLRWDLLNIAQADSDLRWNLLSAALRDSTLQWDIQSALSAVSRDIDLRWHLIVPVQQDVRLDWNLLNSITADSEIRWDILSSIARDADLRWDIQSSLSSVSRDVQLQWNLIAAVEQALEARWDLLESVQIDADLRWHIAVEVARNLTGQWSLLSSAQKDATLQWDMIAVADNAVSLRWTIQSDAGSVLNPIFTLVIPTENRVLTIAAEIRTI